MAGLMRAPMAEAREFPSEPYMPAAMTPESGFRAARATVQRGPYVSHQVNVDNNGANIADDAANEPSIAVDPTNPATIVIGWRQFDTVQSNFRQAGWGFSHDAGETWTFPGVLEPAVFRSDPVLEADADGTIFYYSLSTPGGAFLCDMFRSTDGGISWDEPVFAYGGDKAWFTIDKTDLPSRGNIYAAWSALAGCCGSNIFNRSLSGGASFTFPSPIPENPRWGTMDVGPDGEVYVVGMGASGQVIVAKSTNAHLFPTPSFSQVVGVDLGGVPNSFDAFSPNPGGLLGQLTIAVDRSEGSRRGHVYVLGSVNPNSDDPLEVMMSRSTDGGLTWSKPIRVNDDPEGLNAWQWFAVLSVAPNGRLDAVWNDTRADPLANHSELYYAQSTDGGESWSANVPVSPPYNHFVGYPNQNKLGDYYDMHSDEGGASVAYAATFNGEQDVYYLRIGELDCNGNGVPDDVDVKNGTSDDCDANGLPDECGRDCNGNGEADSCDVINGLDEDCNNNLVPDGCEADMDGDGVINACDDDRDGDGVLNGNDLCPSSPTGFPVKANGGPLGDANADCLITRADHAVFAPCLLGGGPNETSSRTCRTVFDFDADQDVDLRDAQWMQFAHGGPYPIPSPPGNGVEP